MTTRPDILLDSTKQLTTLTERQREVATLVCKGLSNKMIGRQLGVAEGTVKIHLYAIYEKLTVRSRMDLILRFGTLRMQVATLARRRLSNREIAEKLRLTVGTVETQLYAIYEKLNLHSRVELRTALTCRGKSKHDGAPLLDLAQEAEGASSLSLST